jgi:DNA helicase-2/ATP-dependent DNA helicase PcrA
VASSVTTSTSATTRLTRIDVAMPSGCSRTCARCAAPPRPSPSTTSVRRSAAFLDHAAGLHAQEVDAASDRRITVSTIHRSKGAEAQAVALLGCEEQLLPSWRSISSPDPERLAEERRLFYVAATRAKDRLLITHVADRGRRPTGGPSRFLTEAGLQDTASSLAA